MRLHHLQISAFGPFADTVDVDFDELADAGLFLLSGATGAGKTSVLDAVCFALYGDVPGDRNAAKRLRSDQAAPGVRPEVTLEVTIGGRRFRFVRSPSWERPKKRGPGTTTQQAAVSVSERLEGAWQPLSSRLDETGHLVTHLVGMNVTQFTQVAMLPQGRFQEFLRARSDDRHRLLQQLFRTGRFEQVERWLRDRRISLRRDCDTAHQRVVDVLSRISETADTELPEGWDVHDLGLTAADGATLAWAAGLRVLTERSRHEAAAAAETTTAVESRARLALEQARADHARRQRYEQASAERRALLARADDHATAARRLDAARWAAGVAPLHSLAVSAGRQCELAQAGSAAALTRLVAAGGAAAADAPAITSFVDAKVEAVARVRALLPRAGRLADIEAEIAAVSAATGALLDRLAEVTSRCDSAPARVAALRASLTEAQSASVAVEGKRQRLETVVARLHAHAEVVALRESVASARDRWRTTQATTLTLRQTWLDVREARLESMAAEIAGALAVGDSCPVCGSADHPHKAQPGPGASDAAAEKAALKALDDANVTEHLRDVEVRDLETRLAAASGRAGEIGPDELESERREVAAEIDRLRLVADETESLTARVAATQAESESDADLVRRLGVEAAEKAAHAGQLAAEQTTLRDEVSAALADYGHPDLDTLLAAETTAVEAGSAALQALARHDQAEAAYAVAQREVTGAAEEAGFTSARDAVAAVLDADSLTRLAAEISTHDRRLAAVEEVLAEPGADHETDLPDLGVLGAAHAGALEALTESQGRTALLDARGRRLDQLADSLHRAVEAWTPLRDDLEVTTRLTAFVEGKAPDNRHQMRLSAYVLAYRLSQVVSAANERLAGMSDRRYSLEHTARRGAGETRGGLSLRIRDDWSGESRDPATLSGGETFVVSLALALGLADVITQESDPDAAGSGLETLFVDEGFGSLDADTLDDVMDTLDSLRDGGRVVGVVSHVAEMRDRIPTQLIVTKSRHGSTLAVRR